MNGADTGSVVELNIGGVFYSTSVDTLRREKNSRLARLFAANETELPRDSKGRLFIDRDGVLFRYVLDFLRNGKLTLPENFHERERLRIEARYYELVELLHSLDPSPSALSPISAPSSSAAATAPTPAQSSTMKKSTSRDRLPAARKKERAKAEDSSYRGPSSIVVGYRGTFAFGRDGVAEAKFRKLTRILVHGRVATCREVFGDSLNESRDPDRGPADRYTSRFFLKHQFLEQAFDRLLQSGFLLRGSCASGTNSSGDSAKAVQDTDENRWQHYNEFVFVRD